MPEIELPESPYDELLRTEWIDSDPDHARARIPMRDQLRQPMGLMHGGVMASLIESICSRATAIAVIGDGMVAMGQSISMNLLRPVTEGGVEVTAEAIHRGRTTWVWQARVEDFEGRPCAAAQMTIAVRPYRAG